MKIEATPKEIAELLLAIVSSQEQKLINDYEAAKIVSEAYSIRNHQTHR